MPYQTIALIGGGNMARSLVGGLIADGWPAENLRISDPDARQLEFISNQCGSVYTTQRNAEAIDSADAVVFSVKPQNMKSMATHLSLELQANQPLIISIAAGIRADDIARWLGGDFPVVRCMPNTPALVKSGATGLFANSNVSQQQRQLAETVMRAVGLTIWVDDEPLLDAVTALSGSGPAYFLKVMEVIEHAGVELGLDQDTSRLLTLQTAFGTAKLALESQDSVTTLRTRVTSKGGTTEQAMKELEKGQLEQLFNHALQAAAARARTLADDFGNE